MKSAVRNSIAPLLLTIFTFSRLPILTESLSTSSMPPPNVAPIIADADSGTVISNRIYVSGLRKSASFKEEDLQQEFGKFGQVKSVEIIDYENQHKKSSKRKKREPFAFVTFESEDVAQQVLSTFAKYDVNDETPLYSIVKRANPLMPRYAKRIRKSLSEQEQILDICQQDQKPTLLLQVHSSHLDRMIQYIADLAKEIDENEDAHTFPAPLTVGSSSSKAKNISFVFVHIPVITKEYEYESMRSYWYHHFITTERLARFGIRKVYAVDQIVRVPSVLQQDEKRADLVVEHALNGLEAQLVAGLDADADTDKKYDVILKAQTFPPKQNNLQHRVIASLDRKIDIIEQGMKVVGDSQDPSSPPTSSQFPYPALHRSNVSMSSSAYTHILSCVQIFNPRQNSSSMRSKDNCTVDEIFMVGVSPVNSKFNEVDSDAKVVDANINDNDSSKEVCRAYFKLKEVMENYRRNVKNVAMNFKGLDAFDCGSSPGGWTKYLLENEGCRSCYSCDPGALDDSVKTMDGTKHLQMRGNDAIDLLQKEGKKVDLWVSDMCLADPKHQVDHLLLAKEKGILNDSAFFVLTLKFNTGHSKDTFDLFTREELKRLNKNMKVENVRTYHLFSNRKGERTVIGRIGS